MGLDYLLGYPYLNSKKFIKKTEYFSRSDILKLQSNLLKKILVYSINEIPFYKEMFRHKNLSYDKVDNKILERFPLIDKTIIRKDIKKFIKGQSVRNLKVTTGGSTGTPFAFYMDRFVTRQKEKAFIFDQWGRVGYKFRDKIFNLRGRTPNKKSFFEHDKFFNIFHASSFNLDSNSIHDYISFVNRIKPKFIHGYPSTIYQFALLIKKSKNSISFRPNSIFCCSEKLFEFQKKIIEEVFDTKVFHWYGHSEYLSLGGYCEFSNKLHFYPQYGFTELLPTVVQDKNGRLIHEIVSTGFNNYVMPLIRYQTGDFAILSEKQNCECGRNYLLIDEVIGREQEFIVTNSGSLISATSSIFGQHYKIFENIEAINIVQEKIGEIEILVVKGKSFNEKRYYEMKNIIGKLLNKKIRIRYRFKEKYEKSPIGKAKLVKQKLNINEFLN